MRRFRFMEFGEKLRKLRKEQHLTQLQLAQRLGVVKSVVSYYENGERFPSYDVLTRISRTFHVTTDYLLGTETRRSLDVSDLSDEHIAILENMANALRKASRKSPRR